MKRRRRKKGKGGENDKNRESRTEKGEGEEEEEQSNSSSFFPTFLSVHGQASRMNAIQPINWIYNPGRLSQLCLIFLSLFSPARTRKQLTSCCLVDI